MKKRTISRIAVMLLVVAIVASMVSVASAYYAVYSHCGNGKPLNVRSGPGKDYAVIDKVPYGEAIYVIGETSPGWLQLNDIGFVQASLTSRNYPGPYVPGPTPDPAQKKKTSLESVIATAKTVDPYMVTLKATVRSNGKANIRWLPSKTSKLLKTCAPGTQVKVIAELKNWYQVEDPMTGEVGYVNTAYVVK